MMKIRNTSFTKDSVMRIYYRFLEKAEKLYKRHRYNKCIKFIMMAARWMYFFNIIYFDKRIEHLIQSVSNSLFKNSTTYVTDSNCVVFLDSICTTKCLGVQYLSALMALNKKIVYILHYKSSQSADILKILDNYSNKEIHVIADKTPYVDTAVKVHEIIEQCRPSGILLHMWAHDVVSLIAIANIKSAIKYNIDLQDHTFWIGRSFIDYDIVFRNYGEKVATEKRQLTDSEVIRLPYYPLLQSDSHFLGFQDDLPEDAVIVFSGGATYKMLGKEDTFFKLIDQILKISNKVHVLLATVVSDEIKHKIESIDSNHHIHFIGMRKDLDQVFKHSDIYLSTYPIIGGLMSQYAAAYGLPILAYAEENEPKVVEGMVNHKFSAMKTRRSMKAFADYAQKLINDPNFRESEGNRNKEAMFSKEDFILGLDNALSVYKTDLQWSHKENPDYDSMVDFYLENENKHSHLALLYAIRNIGVEVFNIFFKESWTILQLICRESKKIKKFIVH